MKKVPLITPTAAAKMVKDGDTLLQGGVGGAMDLAKGAKRLIITMTHTNPDGSPKIVPACALPLTATGVVDMIITDLAVFAFPNGRLTLLELMPGATLELVRERTSAAFVA